MEVSLCVCREGVSFSYLLLLWFLTTYAELSVAVVCTLQSVSRQTDDSGFTRNQVKP